MLRWMSSQISFCHQKPLTERFFSSLFKQCSATQKAATKYTKEKRLLKSLWLDELFEVFMCINFHSLNWISFLSSIFLSKWRKTAETMTEMHINCAFKYLGRTKETEFIRNNNGCKLASAFFRVWCKKSCMQAFVHSKL